MSRAARLDGILEAAARVLGDRGWHGTTMREVSKAADVGLATLYHYLSGREDLLYQTEMRILEAAVTSAQAALAGRGARERLRALLTDHIRRVQAHPAASAVLSGQVGTLRGERERRVEELRRRYLEVVGAAVDAAVHPARRRRQETEERVALLLGMADRLALTGPPSRTPSRLASRALTVFLEGVLGRRR